MNTVHSKVLTNDINQLVTLHALLETASVSEASAMIGRSQSAVSHALNRLRDVFDDPLLVRSGRSMRLTETALAMRNDVSELVSLSTKILAPNEYFDPSTSKRPIRVASLDIGLPLLAPVFARLAETAPNCPISVVNATSAIEAVKYGEADIGLTFQTPQTTDRLVVHDIGKLSWCTFGTVDHPFQRSGAMSDWLAARHIVVAAEVGGAGPVDATLNQLDQRRDIALRVPSFAAALMMVQATNALFTSLQMPLETLSTRLGLISRPAPLDLPLPHVRVLTSAREDPFHQFLRDGFSDCLGS